MTTPMLANKRLLITGVVNTDSIAYATAVAAIDAGAEIILSSLGRDLDATTLAAETLRGEVDVLEADLTDPEHLTRLTDHLDRRWGRLDGALHAVAFAPRDALAGDFLATSSEAAGRAFQTSTHSYASLASVLQALAPTQGGSIVGLDFDAAGAWPVYNWMGVCKAALESVNRYLARDLGAHGVRSNLVAAGPIRTMAAKSIPGFATFEQVWGERAPLGWDVDDAEPVAQACVALLSDWFPATTGTIVHVDGGFRAVGA